VDRDRIREALLSDPAVLTAIRQHAAERGIAESQVRAQVNHYVDEIVPFFNVLSYYKLGYNLSRLLINLLYKATIEYRDQAALDRMPRRDVVVYLMNHRSNADYVVVAYVMARMVSISYAVGEWARVWPLQQLVRAMGAYFVRRSSKDELYRRVLERYIVMATEAGVTQAVYPEGGLSRDGRMREPKLGAIDYMLRGFHPDGDRDLVFIPLGINYDRVLEDRTLLLDLDPEAPRKGGLAAARTALGFFGRNLRQALTSKWHRFGYAGVSFGRPVSVRAWLAERGALDLRRLGREERFAEVGRLAARLMDEVGRAIPALPVAVAATVFVRRFAEEGGPMSGLEAKARIFALQQELAARGALVYIPRGDSEYAAEVGLRILTLRRLVDARDGAYAARPAERAALAYYANSIAHLLDAGAAGP
jgi:glycerol-3-phosphate O-acyltransferase